MSKLVLLLVAISNLVGGIEIASDFDIDFAAPVNLTLETSHAGGAADPEHAEEQECEHCAHAAVHLLGCISIQLLTQPEPLAYQLTEFLDNFRSQHIRPAIPPNIEASA